MLEKNVPEYYPAMYQDGYTPTEILAAMRNIHFTAKVEVKK